MIRKLLFVSLGCACAASALGGACHGQACRYTYFDKDADGCLEIRNAGRVADTGQSPFRSPDQTCSVKRCSLKLSPT